MLVYDGSSDGFAQGVDVLSGVNLNSTVYEHKYPQREPKDLSEAVCLTISSQNKIEK